MKGAFPHPMFFEVDSYGEVVITVEANIPDGNVYLEAVSIIRQSGGVLVIEKLNDAGISAREFIPHQIELYPEVD